MLYGETCCTSRHLSYSIQRGYSVKSVLLIVVKLNMETKVSLLLLLLLLLLMLFDDGSQYSLTNCYSAILMLLVFGVEAAVDYNRADSSN